jgi:hypothetical protein
MMRQAAALLAAMIHVSIAWSGVQRRAERKHGSSQIDHKEQRVGPVKKAKFPKFRGSQNG